MPAGKAAKRSAFGMLCEDLIGSGAGRKVYKTHLLPGLVVKVEEAGRSFQNVIEWETWQRVKDTKAAKWFAPCESISSDGIILVMAQTTQPALDQYPIKMPSFMTDFKRTNYGMYQGRLVAHDYGIPICMDYGIFSKRMRNVEWWDV